MRSQCNVRYSLLRVIISADCLHATVVPTYVNQLNAGGFIGCDLIKLHYFEPKMKQKNVALSCRQRSKVKGQINK